MGARKQRGVRDNIFVISAISNSVLNGNSQPIQVQIMDAEKCFDKLWLQSCINAIYEAGMDTDQLNLLYIENRNAQIAVKVNNKLSMRINVKDVIMQGSVWSSLKCTTSMDRLNKTALLDISTWENFCHRREGYLKRSKTEGRRVGEGLPDQGYPGRGRHGYQSSRGRPPSQTKHPCKQPSILGRGLVECNRAAAGTT